MQERPRTRASHRPSTPWRLGTRVAVAALAIAAVGLLAALRWYLALPDPAALAEANPRSTAFMDRYRARRGDDTTLPALRWTWVDADRISVHVKRAAVSAEDMEFFFHNGFSTSEISVALREALKEGRGLRGASTISQQLAKNLWLSPSRSIGRKLAEVVLTWKLERSVSKARILELYLNVVEFGIGIYGVEAAANVYFGKTAADLTETEGAMLAASLPRPSQWHPGVTSDSYERYVDDVLGRMARAEFLWRYVGNDSVERDVR